MSHKSLAKQIVVLQKENQLARAVNTDKTVWDVGLRLNCGRIVCLRTHLPKGFPKRAAPHMEIVLPANLVARAQHQWLDDNMRVVGCAELNAWAKTKHALIGPILKRAVNFFIRTPPVLISLVPTPAVRPQAAQSQYAYVPRGYPQQRPPPYPQQQTQPHPSYPAPPPGAFNNNPSPPYPGHHGRPTYARPPVTAAPKPKPPPPPVVRLPEVDTMSKNIVKLLEGELRLTDSFVIPDLMRFGLREVRQKHEEHIGLSEKNVKLAEANLKLRGQLDILKSEFQSLHAQARTKHTEYAQVKQELIKIRQTMTAAYAHEAVSAAAEEIDEACTQMVDDFVYDDMGLKDFETEFLKSRELYHKRTALLELQR